MSTFEILPERASREVYRTLIEERRLVDLTWRLVGRNGGRITTVYLPCYQAYGFLGSQTVQEEAVNRTILESVLTGEARRDCLYMDGVPPMPADEREYGYPFPNAFCIRMPRIERRMQDRQPGYDYGVFVSEWQEPTHQEMAVLRGELRKRTTVSLEGAFVHQPERILRATLALIRQLWSVEQAQDVVLAAFAEQPVRQTLVNDVANWVTTIPSTPWKQALERFVQVLRSEGRSVMAAIWGFALVRREFADRYPSFTKDEIFVQTIEAYARELYPEEVLILDSGFGQMTTILKSL